MDPFEYMKKMQEEIDESFDRFFEKLYRRPYIKPYLSLPETTETPLTIREPLMDLIDDKDHYKVIVELPGINKEDIDINVGKDYISIKAETKTEQKKEEKGYFYRERRYGSFQRTINLPGEIIPDQSTAEYKNGILEIKLKKKEDAKTKEHKITVK